MVAATPLEALRNRIRWRRGYRVGSDDHPEDYESRLTPERMSLMLGTFADSEGSPLATLWVQRPPSLEGLARLRQDPKGRPVFVALVREGALWHQIGVFASVSTALQALSTALSQRAQD